MLHKNDTAPESAEINEKELSRAEAAARIGIKASTLATWATQPPPGLPVLRRIRRGRSVSYFESDVDALIAARRRVIA